MTAWVGVLQVLVALWFAALGVDVMQRWRPAYRSAEQGLLDGFVLGAVAVATHGVLTVAGVAG